MVSCRAPAARQAAAGNIRAGDVVLLSGTLGDDGIAVLAARGELAFRTTVVSDVAPLNGLVEAVYASGARVHAMRDPTRGGLASALNEMAARSRVSVVLEEGAIPVRAEVDGACEMLGFDPLHVANEGKVVLFVPESDYEAVLRAMQAHPLGAEAVRIGRVGPIPRAGCSWRRPSAGRGSWTCRRGNCCPGSADRSGLPVPAASHS